MKRSKPTKSKKQSPAKGKPKAKRAVTNRYAPRKPSAISGGHPFVYNPGQLQDAYRSIFPVVAGSLWDANASLFSTLVDAYFEATGAAAVKAARAAIDQFLQTMITQGGGPKNTKAAASNEQIAAYVDIFRPDSPLEPLWSCADESHPGGATSSDLAALYHTLVFDNPFPYSALINPAIAWSKAQTSQTRSDFIDALRTAGNMPSLSPSDDQLTAMAQVLASPEYESIAPFNVPGNTY
jgi:hypothetical protein